MKTAVNIGLSGGETRSVDFDRPVQVVACCVLKTKTQRKGSLRPYSLDRSRKYFFQVAPQLH
jgi:hypothetical protein